MHTMHQHHPPVDGACCMISLSEGETYPVRHSPRSCLAVDSPKPVDLAPVLRRRAYQRPWRGRRSARQCGRNNSRWRDERLRGV